MALRRPASVGSTTNPPSGSTILKQSGGTFVMKVWAVDTDDHVHNWADITGDGDAVPTYAHNSQQTARVTIHGAVITGAEIGIQQLSGSSNPGTFRYMQDSAGDDGAFRQYNLLVLSIKTRWHRTGVFIPCSVHGISSGSAIASIETAS